MQSFPALSLDQLMVWLREVLTSPTLQGMPARLLAATLATYHNSQTGATFPSIRTLATMMNCSPKTVIAGYRALEADGRLKHIERRSGPLTRDKMSHQYVLLLRGDLTVSRAAHQTPRGGLGSGQQWQEFPQACTPEATTPVAVAPTKRPNSNDKPERPEAKGPEAEDDGASAPCSENRLLRLARRIQRLANGKGWRLENAKATVHRALRRAGKEAVERLIDQLEDGDQRPAYELQGMLDGLRHRETVVSGEGATVGPLDAAHHCAAALYRSCRAGGGVVDFSLWKRIEARLAAAGISGPFRWNDERSMIAAMTHAIRLGTLAWEGI